MPRGRPPKKRPQFGVFSDTPVSPPPPINPYLDIIKKTPPLRHLNISFKEHVDPITLRGGNILQPSLLKRKQGDIAERVNLQYKPRETERILGRSDFPIEVNKEGSYVPIGLLIHSQKTPRVSHISVDYPNRGLKSDIIYEVLKRKGEIHLKLNENFEPWEKMGAEYINPSDRDPVFRRQQRNVGASLGLQSAYVESDEVKTPMRLTREGFEAAHIPLEPFGALGTGLYPEKLPAHAKVPVDVVPKEYSWDYVLHGKSPRYVPHNAPGTQHSPPRQVRRYYDTEIKEGYVAPNVPLPEAISKPYEYKMTSPLTRTIEPSKKKPEAEVKSGSEEEADEIVKSLEETTKS